MTNTYLITHKATGETCGRVKNQKNAKSAIAEFVAAFPEENKNLLTADKVQDETTKTIKLTHTINGEDWVDAVVRSNSGMHHRGCGSSYAVHCNGRSGLYVTVVQNGGDWKVPEGARLCKKCFGS